MIPSKIIHDVMDKYYIYIIVILFYNVDVFLNGHTEVKNLKHLLQTKVIHVIILLKIHVNIEILYRKINDVNNNKKVVMDIKKVF